MKEHKRTEEQQKDLIFDTFLEWHNSMHSDRTQTHFSHLCEHVYKWYKDYRPKKADDMGLEIAEVINEFMNKDKKLNIPKEKDGFFAYLNASLKNERAGSDRDYNENDTIRIPKEKKQKLREIEGVFRMKESQLGRKLSNDERMQSISKWFKKQEYVDLLNVTNIGTISYTSNDENDEIDVLNFVKIHSGDPLDEYITKVGMETVLEAIKFVFRKKQERVRDCYKALFTLYCIKNDLRELYPILDQEIINSSHNGGKKPKQYEIYLKYHPGIDKKSAEAMASTDLREFLNDIKTYLKEKNK